MRMSPAGKASGHATHQRPFNAATKAQPASAQKAASLYAIEKAMLIGDTATSATAISSARRPIPGMWLAS